VARRAVSRLRSKGVFGENDGPGNVPRSLGKVSKSMEAGEAGCVSGGVFQEVAWLKRERSRTDKGQELREASSKREGRPRGTRSVREVSSRKNGGDHSGRNLHDMEHDHERTWRVLKMLGGGRE